MASAVANWADLENDDNELDEVVTRDAAGNRVVSAYYRESDGRQMKCERTYAVEEVISYVPQKVEERQASWKKFGLEALNFNLASDKKYQTISFEQEEKLDPPKRRGLLVENDATQGIADVKPIEPPKKLMLEVQKMLDAVSSASPHEALAAIQASERKKDERLTERLPGDTAPHRNHTEQDDRTVRVTNLPDYVDEVQIYQLFNRVGDVSRHFLVRNKETNQSRGFAFISYKTKEDAKCAIDKLHGKGFCGAVLNVEWARRKIET
ncbi:eukaryotic translation initiation factor 3 subunit G [Gregarina niphandrodes]|uniref:Eukaryotic translation initiation factor 3 subunit G n=1 Tax=Gregarina niphandrodes TaxID=110365 RepID=A0A023AYS9_GRENI|nr:eukaryotic translation initiation factor 3 subunit G [Gregarina niphandrodes]EZG43789.1 eukaryotic translation initiation factor 3 subunit G [Gregarina niphandrodes]|eukprot:XP_011134599.1 eukaryotic translation initiation factor 3 subunit G [Gregarina niphandrodes]